MKQNSEKELFIVAFDHRTTFKEKLFSVKHRLLTDVEKKQISEYKKVIFEGFKKAVDISVPKEASGILVDEEFGSDIARAAKAEGYTLAMPAEASGQKEFDFQYDGAFKDHIEKFDPTYVKVLVRYNPQGDRETNERQTRRLKILNDYLYKTSRPLLFELLVPPTTKQMSELANSKERYDLEIRPQLMVAAMRELQQGGIEPTIWKLEGVRKENAAQALVKQAREAGRKAEVIILGRGASKERVQEWLKIGARTSGMVGFAVGRTIFWQSLIELKNGSIGRETAINQISKNYSEFVDFWRNQKQTYLEK